MQLCFVTMVYSQGLSLPYSTGFDNAGQQAGWQQYRTGNAPGAFDWNIGATGFSPPNQLSHDYNVGGANTDTVIDWYVSPPMNIINGATISLKVFTSGFSIPFSDNCELRFSHSDPDPATATYIILANLSFMQPQFQWLDTTVSMPFVSDSGYFAIRYKTIGAAWMTYGIDNIEISGLTAVGENNLAGNLNVFPNPFPSDAVIHCPANLINAQLLIYDAFGKKVYQQENISGSDVALRRNELSEGVYFIFLKDENGSSQYQRIIIAD